MKIFVISKYSNIAPTILSDLNTGDKSFFISKLSLQYSNIANTIYAYLNTTDKSSLSQNLVCPFIIFWILLVTQTLFLGMLAIYTAWSEYSWLKLLYLTLLFTHNVPFYNIVYNIWIFYTRNYSYHNLGRSECSWQKLLDLII